MTERKVEYYTNGNIFYEIYKLNGKFHREEDKPAYVSYYLNGNIKVEAYYLDGKIHRIDNKPHRIEYSENGMIETWYWYENYREIKKEIHDISLELTKACKD